MEKQALMDQQLLMDESADTPYTPRINEIGEIETNKEIILGALWLLKNIADKQIIKYTNIEKWAQKDKNDNIETINVFKSTITIYKSFLGMMTIRNIENIEDSKLELHVEIGSFQCQKQIAQEWENHFSNKYNMKLYVPIKNETMIFSKNILYLESTMANELKRFANSIS